MPSPSSGDSFEKPSSLKAAVEQGGFEKIGQRVRRHRQTSGLSLSDLSDRAQISKNTLLRLERGQKIQIASLKRIARALGLKIRNLLEDDVESFIIATHRRSDDRWFDMNTFLNLKRSAPLDAGEETQTNPGVIPFCLLKSRFPSGEFNPNLVRITEATKPKSHRGEEFVFVLEGKMALCFDNYRVVLEERESTLFFASETHWYEPVGGAPCLALSIVFDPFPADWPYEPDC